MKISKRNAIKKIRLAFPNYTVKFFDSDSTRIHVAVYRKGKLITEFFINKIGKQKSFSVGVIDNSLRDIKYIFSKALSDNFDNE